MANILEARVSNDRAFGLPKQASPLVVEAGLAGISAFAFQGTNAHAILAESHSGSNLDCQQTVTPFVKARMWYSSVVPHAMVHSASSKAGESFSNCKIDCSEA